MTAISTTARCRGLLERHLMGAKMEYMLIFREDQSTFGNRKNAGGANPEWDRDSARWGAWAAYIGALRGAGIVRSGNGLQPPDTATVVRVRDGARQVQDGPYADTKEQLGGYFIIDVPDLDQALEWAARSPAASEGSVEVRPVMPPIQG